MCHPFYFFSTERAALDTILSNYSVISKVTNSSRKLPGQKITKFENYCKTAYIFRLKSFPYWPMNDSIHRIWGHSAQQMIKLGKPQWFQFLLTFKHFVISTVENNIFLIHSNLDIANKSIRPFLVTISNYSLYQM